MDYTKYDKHTPGPWEADEVGDVYGRKYRVCELVDAHGDAIGGNPHESHLLADGALIADAPALLERCKRLEAALRDMLDTHVYGCTQMSAQTAQDVARELLDDE